MGRVRAPRVYRNVRNRAGRSYEEDRRLEWVEHAAIECLKSHHHSADVVLKEAVTTLTVLLVGIGGGLAYAAKGVEAATWSWLTQGAVVFTIYLLGISLLLICKCLMIAEIPSVYNEPKNLNQPSFPLVAIREAELENIQKRIDHAAARNFRTATSLNRLRVAAALSPIAFIVSVALWAWAPALLAAGGHFVDSLCGQAAVAGHLVC